MADKMGMKTIDFQRASLLLSVMTNAAANGAMFNALMSEAQTELNEMNKDATENVNARAKQAQENQSYAQPKALDTAPETTQRTTPGQPGYPAPHPADVKPAEAGAKPHEAGAKPAEPGPKHDEGKRK